jgi:hypothetical protein
MTRTVTIRIEVSLYEEIEAIANEEDRNINGQIVNLIKLGKERYERQKAVFAQADKKLLEEDISGIEPNRHVVG